MENNLVHRLPDSYAKPVRGREAETATNTWRLFAVSEEQSSVFRGQIAQMERLLDIYNCTGSSLDAIGAMYCFTRKSGLSDEVYRMQLLYKIGSYFSDATVNSILQAVTNACGTQMGDLYFKETTPAMVRLYISAQAAQQLPISIQELQSGISDLLAAGVGLEAEVMVIGTFRYCSAGEEKSESWTGTGYNEPSAGFGTVKRMEE